MCRTDWLLFCVIVAGSVLLGYGVSLILAGEFCPHAVPAMCFGVLIVITALAAAMRVG